MRQVKASHEWYGYIYLFESQGLYKIGRSHTPAIRRRRLQTGSPTPIRTVHTLKTVFHKWIEQQLHSRFADKRVRGEWFALTDEDVAYIKSLTRSGRTSEEEAQKEADTKAYYASEEYARKQRDLHDWLQNGGYPPWDKRRAATTALQTT